MPAGSQRTLISIPEIIITLWTGKVKENGDLSTRFQLDKNIKVRTRWIMINRKKRKFRDGDIIDIEEYHDGRYGAPGRRRGKREKPTKEDK